MFASHFYRHLSDCLHERWHLEIADGAAYLRDDDVRIGIRAELINATFNLIGDMRDKLHRFAEIIAAPLLRDNLAIHGAGGEVGVPIQIDAEEAFIGADIQVCFGTIMCDEHFTVLERVHHAGIDVEVRIYFDYHHFKSLVDEQPA